jgi:hypothetical protein
MRGSRQRALSNRSLILQRPWSYMGLANRVPKPTDISKVTAGDSLQARLKTPHGHIQGGVQLPFQ